MKRNKFGHIKPQCLEAYKRHRKGLSEFMRRYNKNEFSKRTLDFAALWLTSQYNINRYEALAYLSYASMKSKINGYGNVSGQNNVYAYKVFQDILSRYGHELPYDYKRVIDEMHIKVRDIRSPETRQKLLFLEMLAWLQVNRKLQADVTIADRIVDIERRFGGNFVIKMWSKPAFWLMANILVFDTLTQRTAPTANAYDLHLSEDGSTLQIDPKNWYDTRKYMTESERWLWRVYDEVIEEIGRELVAAGLTAYGMHRLTRGLRLFSELVLDLATFHPHIRGLKTISEIAKNIARYIDGSVVVFVASQVFIEWKLEGWFAFHEWSFLKDIRDFLAGYTSPAEVFTQDEFTRLKEYLKKIQFEPWALNATQRDELNQMLELAKYHGLSDILEWYRYATFMFERFAWFGSMMKSQSMLEDRMLREDEFNPMFREKAKSEIRKDIEVLLNELKNDVREQINEDDIKIKFVSNPASRVYRDYPLPDLKYEVRTYKEKNKTDYSEYYNVSVITFLSGDHLMLKGKIKTPVYDITGSYAGSKNSTGKSYYRYCNKGLNYKIDLPVSNLLSGITIQVPCLNREHIEVKIRVDDNLEIEHEYELVQKYNDISNRGSHSFVLDGGDIQVNNANHIKNYEVHKHITSYYFNQIPEYIIIPFRINTFKPYLFMVDGKRCIGWKKARTKIIEKAIRFPFIPNVDMFVHKIHIEEVNSFGSDIEGCFGLNLWSECSEERKNRYECHFDCSVSHYEPSFLIKQGQKRVNSNYKTIKYEIYATANTVRIVTYDITTHVFKSSTGYAKFPDNTFNASDGSSAYKRGYINDVTFYYNGIKPGHKKLPIVDLTDCRINKRAKVICL